MKYEAFNVKIKDLKDILVPDAKVVIDCDSICFDGARNAERTELKIIHKASGREVFKNKETKERFKNKTEFYGRKKIKIEGFLGDLNTEREVKGQSLFAREDFGLQTVQIPHDNASMIYMGHVKREIARIKEHLGINDALCFVGDGKCFRHDLPMPEQYKSNRAGAVRPLALKEAKQYAVDHQEALWVRGGIEVDDCINMYAHKSWAHYKKTGKHLYVVVSPDKDSGGFNSLWFNNYLEKGDFKHEVVYNIDGWGGCWLDNGTLKGLGQSFLISQMLLGDVADHYYPFKWFKKSYGATACYKDLFECKSLRDGLVMAGRKFNEMLPDGVEYTSWDGQHVKYQAIEWMSVMFTAAYMRSKPNDSLQLGDLLRHCNISDEELRG